MFSLVKIDKREFKKSLVRLWNFERLLASLLVLHLSSSRVCLSAEMLLLLLDVFMLELFFTWLSKLLGFNVVSESSASKLIEVFLGSSILIFFNNFGASLVSVVLRLEESCYLASD